MLELLKKLRVEFNPNIPIFNEKFLLTHEIQTDSSNKRFYDHIEIEDIDLFEKIEPYIMESVKRGHEISYIANLV